MQPLYFILIFILGLLSAELFRQYFGFHSFFKKQKDSWIGFDLDGTIATKYSGPFNPRIIGEPIPSMISLIQEYIREGKEVKIVTARVSTDGTLISLYNAIIGQYIIQAWCKKHIGQTLDVISAKDFKMRLLYDDLAIQVKTDSGELVQ
jgi:hypothetical protein